MPRLHNVEFIHQQSQNTCWFACLKMLVRYELRVGNPLQRDMLSAFSNYTTENLIALLRGDRGGRDNDLIQLALSLGMQRVPFRRYYTAPDAFGRISPNNNDSSIDLRMNSIEQLLNYRPFAMPCAVRRSDNAIGFHVIVVRGYSNRQRGGQTVMEYYYHDPAYTGPLPAVGVSTYNDLIYHYVPDGGYLLTF